MPAARVKFKERLLYGNIGSAYPCSNEMLNILGDLVDEARKIGPVKKVGSICSGGDIPLQVLAPRGCKVKAIDYSRESLLWAVSKTMLLQSLAPSRVREILSTDYIFDAPEWLECLEKCRRMGLVVTQNYEKNTARSSATASKHLGIKKYWEKLTDDQITAIAKASRKIEFIHGDLSMHLAPEGPFDMIYTSNALTFTTIGGQYGIKVDDLVKSLRPGGFLLSTSDPRYNSKSGYNTLDSIEVLKSQAGNDSTSGYVHWTYYLSRPKVTVPKVEVKK